MALKYAHFSPPILSIYFWHFITSYLFASISLITSSSQRKIFRQICQVYSSKIKLVNVNFLIEKKRLARVACLSGNVAKFFIKNCLLLPSPLSQTNYAWLICSVTLLFVQIPPLTWETRAVLRKGKHLARFSDIILIILLKMERAKILKINFTYWVEVLRLGGITSSNQEGLKGAYISGASA